MLKKLEEKDAQVLHGHLSKPSLVYVRYRSDSLEEYKQITSELIKKEEKKEAIVRVILNEKKLPVGQIALYDLENNTGFLSTWLAEEYQGIGLNQKVKERFLFELFHQEGIHVVYAKIRKANIRSLKAFAKLPYMKEITDATHPVYQKMNHQYASYDVFEIHKHEFDCYISKKRATE